MYIIIFNHRILKFLIYIMVNNVSTAATTIMDSYEEYQNRNGVLNSNGGKY